jgi:hypothetical protein
MVCGDTLKFARVQHIGKTNVIRRLEHGLKFFLDWAFLGIGSWVDISLTTSGVGGTNASELQLANSPGYTDGQVWQGFRKAWVYESGASYTDVDGSGHSPLSPPSVYVNSILQSSGYSVNYELGQVIFDSTLSSSDTVQASHSFRNVQVYIGDNVPWWQELQFNSWNVDDTHFQQTDRGEWSIGGNHRVQLPIIVVDASLKGSTPPFSLGNSCTLRQQDVKFHVIAEDKCTRDNLTDLLLLQSEKTVIIPDIDTAAANCHLSLDLNGNFIGMQYPDLIDTYQWAYARGSNGQLCEIQSIHPNLYEGMVKITYSLLFSQL